MSAEQVGNQAISAPQKSRSAGGAFSIPIPSELPASSFQPLRQLAQPKLGFWARDLDRVLIARPVQTTLMLKTALGSGSPSFNLLLDSFLANMVQNIGDLGFAVNESLNWWWSVRYTHCERCNQSKQAACQKNANEKMNATICPWGHIAVLSFP